jgi:transposase InsO family protein
MDREFNTRRQWIEYYLKVNNVELVCRRCGISRPTLCKWLKRYNQHGLIGLQSRSRRSFHSPNRKIFSKDIEMIQSLRCHWKIGARRIQNELYRNSNLKISLASIHKVLTALQVKPLKRIHRFKKYKRYSRSIPGECVQMDTCKIMAGLYQYTAIDDCSRYKVISIYPRRSANNTIKFLDEVIEETPFPIQRIQTDRGKEFFAINVQEKMMDYCIKFRPIKPRSPHLNGKVERTQLTDLEEFYTTVDIKDPELFLRLKKWQHYYNWFRSHGGLNGKTPTEKCHELLTQTPYLDEVLESYDITRERIQEQNYYIDLQIRKVKRCL